jgi:Hint domain
MTNQPRKILVNEDKLLGIRCIGRPIGVKIGGPAPVCYLRGTHIRTPEGKRRIEELKIGDLIVTLSGECKPIKWIGRQRFKKSSESWPKDFEPIRISRFALDARTPHRDLYLSPNHAVYVDGVLIPAKYLVNGINITQAAPEGADIIDYLHIELFAHDVIYAEGATAETFGSLRQARDHFDNFYEYYRLYSNEDEAVHAPCAPLLWGQPRFDRILRPLRSALEPWIDTRTTVDKMRDKIRDRLAARARDLVDF